MKQNGYLADLHDKCPKGHSLHVMHGGRLWLVNSVDVSSCKMSPVGSDLSAGHEVKSFPDIKITNYWYVPKEIGFSALSSVEEDV